MWRHDHFLKWVEKKCFPMILRPFLDKSESGQKSRIFYVILRLVLDLSKRSPKKSPLPLMWSDRSLVCYGGVKENSFPLPLLVVWPLPHLPHSSLKGKGGWGGVKPVMKISVTHLFFFNWRDPYNIALKISKSPPHLNGLTTPPTTVFFTRGGRGAVSVSVLFFSSIHLSPKKIALQISTPSLSHYKHYFFCNPICSMNI